MIKHADFSCLPSLQLILLVYWAQQRIPVRLGMLDIVSSVLVYRKISGFRYIVSNAFALHLRIPENFGLIHLSIYRTNSFDVATIEIACRLIVSSIGIIASSSSLVRYPPPTHKQANGPQKINGAGFSSSQCLQTPRTVGYFSPMYGLSLIHI